MIILLELTSTKLYYTFGTVLESHLKPPNSMSSTIQGSKNSANNFVFIQERLFESQLVYLLSYFGHGFMPLTFLVVLTTF